MSVHPRSIDLASEATDRLRQEEEPFGIDQKEAICPSCQLAYWVSGGVGGTCFDCHAELEIL